MRPQHNPAGTWLIATQGVVFALAVYTFVLVWGYFASWSIAKHRVETAWFILIGVAWFVASLKTRLGPRVTWPPAAELGRPPGVVWFVLLAMLSLVLYWPSLSIGFLSDDFVLMGRAMQGEFWNPGTTQFLRPLPLIAWAALASVPVPTPVVVHALNIILHGVNATLVAKLASRLGFAREAGVAAGLLFLCFPASVEAVAWASGVQDVLLVSLCLGFLLACSACSLRRGLPLAVVALVAALGTKETAVAAPAIALVFVWARMSPVRWRWQIPVTGAIVALGYVSWRALAVGIPAGHVETTRYAAKEFVSRAFGTLALPFTGEEVRQFPFFGIGFGLFFVVLTVAASWRWHGEKATRLPVTTLALWVLLSIAPVGAMFYVSPELKGSRYIYLADCGWSLLLAVLLLETASRRWRLIGRVCVSAMLVVFIVGVRNHVAEWQRAAQLRDAVVTSAVEVLRGRDCASIVVAELPESLGGAYVFGNGFQEALALASDRLVLPAPMPGARPCSLRWDGASFQTK